MVEHRPRPTTAKSGRIVMVGENSDSRFNVLSENQGKDQEIFEKEFNVGSLFKNPLT